jgi:hypothetical protein
MSDTSTGGFGKFVPGFDFLQNLATQAAGGIAQGLGQNIPQLPNLSHWVAPTFNVEELEKRIEELKAVHFWLDQNTKALSATIQALEVQKMTLATLKTMNFSMGDVANALKLKAADSLAAFTPPSPPAPEPAAATPVAAPEPAPRRRASPAKKAAAPASGVVDPMQWWGALTQQFQQIASQAVKDVAKQTTLETTRQVAAGLTDQAVKAAARTARGAGRAVGRAVTPKTASATKTASAPRKSAAKSPRSPRR